MLCVKRWALKSQYSARYGPKRTGRSVGAGPSFVGRHASRVWTVTGQKIGLFRILKKPCGSQEHALQGWLGCFMIKWKQSIWTWHWIQKMRFSEILIFAVFGRFDPLANISTSYFIADSESSCNFGPESGFKANIKSCATGKVLAFWLSAYATQHFRFELQMIVTLILIGSVWVWKHP